ncbi:hypothetical protein H0H92_012622 [Tricholoma furcatifolium]|nr:hypothetical protein H0H92_012622 [Tricholoma furcatifolium]
MKFTLFTTVLFSVLSAVHGKPLFRRQSITTLTTSQIDAYTPYTYFASAAYCAPSATLAWNCGANCNANSDFIPYASGGDGDSVQYWYVGYSPSLATVIVGHQGTDPSELTATTILAAVQAVIATHSATKVTTVGHSLGMNSAALALLDGVYLPLHISGVTFQTIGYGLPRAFADYVDANLSLTHINNELSRRSANMFPIPDSKHLNREDPIPICPGMSLGYIHPSGEIHIQDSGAWLSCPGQDNPSTECIVGDVPNILDGDLSDHDGPYNGVEMALVPNDLGRTKSFSRSNINPAFLAGLKFTTSLTTMGQGLLERQRVHSL